MVDMCLAKLRRMGQQQQQGIIFTGVIYAVAAAQVMMIFVSGAYRVTNTAETDSASSLYHQVQRLSSHLSLLFT